MRDSPFVVGESLWRCSSLCAFDSFSLSRVFISAFSLDDSSESLSILACSRTFSCLNCVTIVLFRPSAPLSIPIADPMLSMGYLSQQFEFNWKIKYDVCILMVWWSGCFLVAFIFQNKAFIVRCSTSGKENDFHSIHFCSECCTNLRRAVQLNSA